MKDLLRELQTKSSAMESQLQKDVGKCFALVSKFPGIQREITTLCARNMR